MAALVKYEDFVEEVLKGVHDFDAHTFKFLLTNTAPDVATHTVRADTGELATGGGYTSGGVASAMSVSRTGGTAKLEAADAVFTASGGSIGPFRYAVLYNDTAASDPLIGYVDYGSSITLADGETITVDCDPTTGILTLT